MGKPIILAEQIPKNIFILLEGHVRQLTENPLSGEIMTLNLYKPNHILGLKSMQANQSLEFATAASKCRFAKISYRTWRKLNKNISRQETVEAEILPILRKEKSYPFPKENKELRDLVKDISQECEVKEIFLKSKKTNLNLDKSKNWYFGSNFEEIIYGTNFNFEKIEKYNRSYRIIGIPKEKTFNKIKDINTKNNKTKNKY